LGVFYLLRGFGFTTLSAPVSDSNTPKLSAS
jgi:hypothetical protein